MALRQIIGENVKKYRLEKDLSQQVLAHKAKISISCLRKIKHGEENITVDLLENLAYSLGVEPKDLLVKLSPEELPTKKRAKRKKTERLHNP